jgi:hypothetical protein
MEHFLSTGVRVARWHVFQPKKQIWVNVGGTCDGRFWSILPLFGLFTYLSKWSFVIFYGYLVYFFPFWYVLARKIWQPCQGHLLQLYS